MMQPFSVLIHHNSMKSIFTCVILVILFSSCSKGPQLAIVGDWKLIEQLIDPGDGSGVFVEVESDLLLTFEEDGVLRTNGSICGMSTMSGSQEFIESYTADKIVMQSCFQGSVELAYELIGGYLIIYYQCDEGCQQKFEQQ